MKFVVVHHLTDTVVRLLPMVQISFRRTDWKCHFLFLISQLWVLLQHNMRKTRFSDSTSNFYFEIFHRDFVVINGSPPRSSIGQRILDDYDMSFSDIRTGTVTKRSSIVSANRNVSLEIAIMCVFCPCSFEADKKRMNWKEEVLVGNFPRARACY